jgi:hypothetical protein
MERAERGGVPGMAWACIPEIGCGVLVQFGPWKAEVCMAQVAWPWRAGSIQCVVFPSHLISQVKLSHP